MDGKYYKFARGKKETPKILKEIQYVIAAKKTILVQTGSTDNLMINEMYTTKEGELAPGKKNVSIPGDCVEDVIKTMILALPKSSRDMIQMFIEDGCQLSDIEYLGIEKEESSEDKDDLDEIDVGLQFDSQEDLLEELEEEDFDIDY